ncbi:11936_t:CDS:1, partial [Ambispora leptoticha]
MSEKNSENQQNQQQSPISPPQQPANVITTNTDGIGGFIISSSTSTNNNLSTPPSPPSTIPSSQLPFVAAQSNYISEVGKNNNDFTPEATTFPSMPSSSSVTNHEPPPPYERYDTLNIQSHSNQSTEGQVYNADLAEIQNIPSHSNQSTEGQVYNVDLAEIQSPEPAVTSNITGHILTVVESTTPPTQSQQQNEPHTTVISVENGIAPIHYNVEGTFYCDYCNERVNPRITHGPSDTS